MICAQCSAENPEGARLCRQCGSEFDLPDPLLGQEILGRYRVVSLIGEGGMGRVYLAEQRVGTTTRKVAVKTLRPQLSADKQLARRFFREAETIVRLTHPNTIQFFDFGELSDGTLVIIMEYIEGHSLAHELARGPLSPERADRIFTQICGALAEAHGLGIVHRDLKPDNILLTQRGGQDDFVKVLDFGIAKISQAEDDKSTKLTQQGMMVGTPPYMSPEQFGAETIDARSDIYSLGVIAYEMLTGRLPFSAKTPWEWASKHLTAEPDPLEVDHTRGISEQRVRAIRRALSKAREDRQQDVAELLREFTSADAMGHAPTAAASAPRSQPSPPIPTPVYASSPGATGPGHPLNPPSTHGTAPGSEDEPVRLPATGSRPWLWVGGITMALGLAAVGGFAAWGGEERAIPQVPPPPPTAASAATLPPQLPAAPPPHGQGQVPEPRSEATPSDAPTASPEPEAPQEGRRIRGTRRDREDAPRRTESAKASDLDARAELPARPPAREPTKPSAPAQPVAPSPSAPTPNTQAEASQQPRTPVRVLVPPDLQDRLNRANAAAATQVEVAITLYHATARKYGNDAPGVPALKQKIAHAGEARLRELTQAKRCAQAQSLYRALASMDAAPPKEKHFGRGCDAP